jgi:POT family proton-dependent oligopeptide transporter
MERIIIDPKHTKSTYFLASSKTLERFGYYGLRAMMILYITGDTFSMSRSEALELYAYFTGAYYISNVVGGFIGDLLVGNNRAIIIGGFLQAFGAYMLMFPNTITLYIGFSLVALGGGLYSSNLMAQFGKLYLNKTRLLVAGFTIFTVAINIGAFLGIAIIGALAENISYISGFFASSTALLISVLILIYIKGIKTNDFNKPKLLDIAEEKEVNDHESNKLHPKNHRLSIMIIIGAMMLGSIFMYVYDFAVGEGGIDLKLKFYESVNLPLSFWSDLNAIFIIIIGIAAAITWSFIYKKPIINIAIGFLLGALSLFLIFLIPEDINDYHVVYLMVSVFIMSIAEVLIGPAINSIIVKNVNPKYLAIVFSIRYVPFLLYSTVLGLQGKVFISITIGITILTTIGILLLILGKSKSKKIAGKNQLL